MSDATEDHEEWGSRIARGTFKPEDWAADLKRDIALYQEAAAAVRREVVENEGDDPMRGEYKVLELRRSFAASNIHRHLNHDVLLVIANLVRGSER